MCASLTVVQLTRGLYENFHMQHDMILGVSTKTLKVETS